jgi:hypothetical protein
MFLRKENQQKRKDKVKNRQKYDNFKRIKQAHKEKTDQYSRNA